MLGKELLTYVDHTLLRPIATWDEIKVICEDALAYQRHQFVFHLILWHPLIMHIPI